MDHQLETMERKRRRDGPHGSSTAEHMERKRRRDGPHGSSAGDHGKEAT